MFHDSQDADDVAKGMHFVGDGFRGRIIGKAIEEDCVEPCPFGAKDVGVEVVANHEGGLLGGIGHLEGIVEEEGRGFVGTCVFAEDDGREMVEESAGAEFLVLHFVKTVATHMHPIALSSQVIHQFPGTIDKTRLLSAERKELVAGFEAILFGGKESLPKAVGMTKTLDDEVITVNFSLRILSPQTDVGAPIVVVEDAGVGEVLFEMQVLIQFTQGDDCIAVGVVESVVEVDEKVGVAHGQQSALSRKRII